MKSFRFVSMVAVGALLAACGAQGPAEDGRDDTFLHDAKFDTGGIGEGTVEARGVLALVNAAGRDLLVDDVGIAEKAADAMVNVKIGDDGLVGTADDVAFTTLAQLDAVPFVGPKVFGALVDYARAHGFIATADGGVPPEGDAATLPFEPCGAFVDNDGDGTNDQAWEYDRTRAPAIEEDRLFDIGTDKLVERDVYENDASGRLVKWSLVTPDQPENDIFFTYSYDAEGRLVEETEATREGVYQTTRSFTFEANRQPLVQEIEQTLDGGAKQKDGVTYTRDARGRIITKDTDLKSDGTNDRHMVCTHDDPALTRVCTTTSPSGALLTRETRVVRPDGAMVSLVRVNAAGETTYSTSYTYDAQGRWQTWTVVPFKGAVAEVTTARYQCTPR